jgi:hypothetical protein
MKFSRLATLARILLLCLATFAIGFAVTGGAMLLSGCRTVNVNVASLAAPSAMDANDDASRQSGSQSARLADVRDIKVDVYVVQSKEVPVRALTDNQAQVPVNGGQTQGGMVAGDGSVTDSGTQGNASQTKASLTAADSALPKDATATRKQMVEAVYGKPAETAATWTCTKCAKTYPVAVTKCPDDGTECTTCTPVP